ncbi:hypothetical protein FVEN_g2189 [Fusarium venenatum]|uniref:Uncharacterized protein n=1 Tax=Fusarium venenatum TaxID=56646 RepID=A0A2L2SS53_9HYPO|nr:uncharacterized protein FVRRES_12612 [Fusarium venenatum]KAG8360531.1 hypothetical protein FVEN_g2189 [Fusarium venenatum]KAH6979209.1 hypothetical protein EDB82DRAFT_477926 [Fusarium venenatum]CEI39921.1 unnamed protein product [Fusarium venenatum]
MVPNTGLHEPSATDWTEAEKAELVEYYKFCIEQRDNCIESLEAICQEQEDLEVLHRKQKDSEEKDGDSDDDHDKDVQVQYDDLVRKAIDQVTLMEGYLDILIFIEAEMEASDLSIP